MQPCKWYHKTVSRVENRLIEELEKEYLFAHDPATIDAERIQDTIDTKYCSGDLQKIVDENIHCTQSEMETLLKLLQKFEHLFPETLGAWKREPMDLELKESNVKSSKKSD